MSNVEHLRSLTFGFSKIKHYVKKLTHHGKGTEGNQEMN